MVEKPTYPASLSPEGLSGGAAVQRSSATANPQTRAQNDNSSTTYSNYLFGRSGENDHPLWSDTTKGRIAIRLLSRGVFGALAFAWGSKVAESQMQRYEPETWKWDSSKPLQAVAKGFDATLGKAIQKTAKILAPKGMEAEWAFESTRFRSKAYFHGTAPEMIGGRSVGGLGLDTGRSLGSEMVNVTFNFAAASVADASVRNLAQGIDPHNKKKWLVDENGKPATHGRFLFGEWAKSVGSATWRILSKNQGEDWAAALPYVYQMKWQRQWIANHHPNFKLAADNGWNGASYVVDHEGNVKGDLAKAGAIDLHSRFVGYNWYTLMYREAYDMVGYKLGEWKKGAYQLHAPDLHNPVASAVSGVGSLGRYVLKSFIKSNIYMQPAVLFFWPTRVAQSKMGAGIIVDGAAERTNAIVTSKSMHDDITGLTGKPYAQALDHIVPKMKDCYFKNSDAHGNKIPEYEYRYQSKGMMAKVGSGGDMYYGNHSLAGSEIHRAQTAFDANLQKSTFSKIINPLGKLSASTGNLMNGWFNHHPVTHEAYGKRENFIRDSVNASYAYTPYMIAKAEFALRVDERPNGHTLGAMDKAIYRFIDNGFTFNLKGMWQAAQDIGYHAVRTKEKLSGREGGNDVEAPIPSTEPTSVVQVKTVQKQASRPHDPVQLAKAMAANDNGANDNGERRWSETVGKSADRIPQALSTSLH